MTVRVRLIGRPCVEADIGLAQLDLAVRSNPRLVPALAARLYDDATRAKAIAHHADNPALHASIRALTGSLKHPGKADLR